AYYTQFGVPFQQGGQYRAAASRFYQRNKANPSYQERRQAMEESLSKFMNEKRREENSNPIKEIRASTDPAIRNQGASIKALEIQMGRLYDDCYDEKKGSYGLKDLDTYSIRTTLRNDSLPKKEKDLGSLGELAHTKLTVELADRIVKHPKGIAKNVLVGIGKFIFLVDFIILDMPEDFNVPLILERSFLSTAQAMVDVFKKRLL
nr:hypothetical protein [Tanacetum cinerariifolium]